MNDEGPKTLIEAVRYFSDKKVCHDYMVKIKWPDGKIVCPKCGGDNIGFLATREIYKCRGCKKQFSCKVDTIFEGRARSRRFPRNSSLPLRSGTRNGKRNGRKRRRNHSPASPLLTRAVGEPSM